MKMAILVGSAFGLGGCAVSDGELAKRCGLDEAQLDAAFAEVQDLAPTESRTVGRCTFTRGTGQERVMVVVTKSGQLGAP